MTCLFGVTGMGDSFARKKLHSCEKQVLREHIDDLSTRMVSKPVSQAASSISSSHADVDDFTKIIDDVDAGQVRDQLPINLSEGNRFGKAMHR